MRNLILLILNFILQYLIKKKKKILSFAQKILDLKLLNYWKVIYIVILLFLIVLVSFYQKKIFGGYQYKKFMNFVINIIYSMFGHIFGPVGTKKICGFYGVVLLLKIRFAFFV